MFKLFKKGEPENNKAEAKVEEAEKEELVEIPEPQDIAVENLPAPISPEQVFARSIKDVKKYLLVNGEINIKTIEKMTGMSLEETLENLEKYEDLKMALSIKELQGAVTEALITLEEPAQESWLRKFANKPAVKGVFVAVMLFLKFAPEVQSAEKREMEPIDPSHKTEVSFDQNQSIDDANTYQINEDDFNKIELSPKEFIDHNIENIKDIIQGDKYEEAINNPYLVSSLYYSQKFLNHISKEANRKNMATQIIGPVVEDLSPEFKLAVIDHFKNLSQELEKEKGVELSMLEVTPLESLDFGHGVGHNDAIDLYIKEGSPISAMQDGLVVLAETGWDPNNEASTSSYLGGNTVITYNYQTNEFVRYAHLDEVNVKPGDLIKAGDNLGNVGNSGMNAFKPGHGGHLHLEINKVKADGNNQFVYNKELQTRINNTRALVSN